jgi:hypothetical protein
LKTKSRTCSLNINQRVEDARDTQQNDEGKEFHSSQAEQAKGLMCDNDYDNDCLNRLCVV